MLQAISIEERRRQLVGVSEAGKEEKQSEKEGTGAELGPLPPPPAGSCSCSSKSEVPRGPPTFEHGTEASEEDEDEVTHECGCQWRYSEPPLLDPSA